MNAEIVDLTTISRGFPQSPVPEILRDNLLETLDVIFNGDTSLIIVEGAEGMGKTTLLAQYARRYPNQAISLFLRPISRLAYAPEYLSLVLLEQINWALTGNVPGADTPDSSHLAAQLFGLQKKALKTRTPFYFIVDGLDDIPSDDARSLEAILTDLLPLGLSGFRFLMTGNATRLTPVLHRKVPLKPFQIPMLTLGETLKYLDGLGLEADAATDLHRMCKAVPGHLAITRRILLAGNSVQSILEEDPDNLPDFLAIEWRCVAGADPFQRQLLAVVAYGRRPYATAELAEIL